MKEYINTKNNHKFLAVHWTGSKRSTIQLTPAWIATHITHEHFGNGYQFDNSNIFGNPDTLDVLNVVVTRGGSYHYHIKKLHHGDYLVMQTKCVFATDSYDIFVDVVPAKQFKKLYKEYTPKHSRSSYVLMHTWSNNTFDSDDPVKPIASSNDLARIFKYKCRLEWKQNYSGLYVDRVHRA